MPTFKQKLSRIQCAEDLGLNPDITTLILMAGGLGVCGIYSLTEHLLGIEQELQIISLAGKNQKLLADLQELAKKSPGRLVPMGFTTTIEKVMVASDLAITKPDCLSSSKCLAGCRF